VSASAGVSAISLREKREVILGRAPDCDVVVTDDSMSRRHARLLFAESITIEDLGSKNGTRVMGRTAVRGEPLPLAVGAVFELGSATFVLQWGKIQDAPPSVPRPRLDDPVVQDGTMKNLYALLDLLAPSNLSVLLLGETGVGKEVYAEALHKRSPRSPKAFVAINCAALPESMLEAELFGYERGAFTGAVASKPGLLETADGGTVLLDEVGEIPLSMQAKLLRAVESGQVTRLGALRPTRIDVRLVSATNRDLRALVAEGKFRSDLYFRLNGMTVTLPPLRSRKDDIEPLARHFAPQATFTREAIARLEEHAWPGNVRELRHAVERALVLANGSSVDVKHLVFDGQAPVAQAPSTEGALKEQLRELEKKKVEDALAQAGGNQRDAARILGISRYTLMNRMEAFGLARPRKGK
jgi:transcriptional regulator with PAS, ATPase and Fis domain